MRLRLVLMAWGIGPGDAVICPAFTFCATAEVVALCGATPVMADVEAETFNLDPASCDRAVATAKRLGLKPRVIIPVDLFGLPADHDAIAAVAAAHGMLVLDDAAQAFGASYKGRRLGVFAPATATSFFPAKPLGCYGDGGAIFTDDDALAARLKSLRVHGEGGDKYDAEHIGLTGRLDTMQAAIVLEKLKIFPEEIAARNAAAARYAAGLAGVAMLPQVAPTIDLGLGAIHDPARSRTARRARGCAQGPGHSDGDLLRQAVAPAGGLSALPGGRRRRAGERAPGRGSHQPAHARLSRGAGAGPYHRRRSPSASPASKLVPSSSPRGEDRNGT